ncbi:MAG: hypothetical protein A2Y12_09225 [Planctomycetes bacterium GWF2_42_9]|nr:MAG: hypothetical protein A2Y12_09225 [Planctomycetes bacterium GWF2_42_9]
MTQWFENSYFRLLIDNHISEATTSLMSQFDPANYVSMVKKAGADSAMVYSCDHNGNCYYPTKAGHMHKNLGGRDIFGQTITLLRKENIIPIAYYTWVFHNHSAKSHPQWRMLGPTGKQHDGRYWYSCPNNYEYMDFTKKQIGEVIEYNIDGIYVDMTFWPLVCVCPSCRTRYLKETNKEIPTNINWTNPEWICFQRKREDWLTSFAKEITSFIKTKKTSLTVSHQFSPVMGGWRFGLNTSFPQASDYTSADFYGGRDQQRLGTKIMAEFSQKKPYEFMTSRCINLHDHTSSKSKEELMCESATTLANGGACFFIDAINPDGTLSETFYNLLEEVNFNIKPFKNKIAELKPILLADTGLYFSMQSFVDENLNGCDLSRVNSGINNNMNPLTEIRNIQELTGTSIILNQTQNPYKIITEQSDLNEFKSIIINNALFMSKNEANKIRSFVKNGGTLIATGMTSFYDIDGQTSGNFELKDVFGISYSGQKTKNVNYLVSCDSGNIFLCDKAAPFVNATSANIIGYVAEPDFEPYNESQFTSIHSNPPAQPTKYAGLTVNNFGKGRCIYLYSSLLALQQDAQQSFGRELFKKFIGSNIIVSNNTPMCVETTILKSTIDKTQLLCYVNYQRELPNLPVQNIKTTIRMPENTAPRSCKTVSNNKPIDFLFENGNLRVELPSLNTIEIIEIKLSEE